MNSGRCQFASYKKKALHRALYAASLAMYRNANYKFFSTVVVLFLAPTGSKQEAVWCLAAGWGETMEAV